MRLYRFRIVKPPNDDVAQSEHECSNEAVAATMARTMCDGHYVEVWEGTRWVATIMEYSSGALSARVLP